MLGTFSSLNRASCIAEAPEYALDEVLDPASDMYSLGCLMYAVHCKGVPPWKNHGNLASIREHAGKIPPGMDRLDPDLRGALVCTCLTLFDLSISYH